MRYIDKILNSNKTVFKSDDLSLILGISNKHTLKNILQRLKKSGIIVYHKSALWSLKRYDKYELASKIKGKSYISLETVLQQKGVIFQHYGNTITLVSDRTFEKDIDGVKYNFSKIKDEILLNPLGIVNNGTYLIATKERALCDRIYLTPSYYFDNIDNLDKRLLGDLATIYNKSTNLRIKQIIKDGK